MLGAYVPLTRHLWMSPCRNVRVLEVLRYGLADCYNRQWFGVVAESLTLIL